MLQPPQCEGLLNVCTHWLLHRVNPLVQTHALFEQLAFAPQLLPHEPQFVASLTGLLHWLPQSRYPVGQVGVWQEPEMHFWVPEHVTPQLPQLLGSVCVATQTLEHGLDPDGHWHVPFKQPAYSAHLFAHEPQLFTSLAVLMQMPPQAL